MNQKAKIPLIISFVSGKGGVGKTTLSVAFAKTMSLSMKVLLIDLDFFNRGLTGLMSNAKFFCKLDKPQFISESTKGAWQLEQVEENIYNLKYPDLYDDDLKSFELKGATRLSSDLKEYISNIASICDFDCIVLDCHGGPDTTSFAACLISNYSILVSEPDKITLYGTFNFLRQLENASKTSLYDIRLVLNKVIPSFSGVYLNFFYREKLKKYFNNNPILGIFPLEVYLSKEFEKNPFLTKVYPNSNLARKTELLIHDLLFKSDYFQKLHKWIRKLPRFIRSVRKYSLGKKIAVLNIGLSLTVVGIVALILSVIYQTTSAKLRILDENYANFLMIDIYRKVPEGEKKLFERKMNLGEFLRVRGDDQLFKRTTYSEGLKELQYEDALEAEVLKLLGIAKNDSLASQSEEDEVLRLLGIINESPTITKPVDETGVEPSDSLVKLLRASRLTSAYNDDWAIGKVHFPDDYDNLTSSLDSLLKNNIPKYMTSELNGFKILIEKNIKRLNVFKEINELVDRQSSNMVLIAIAWILLSIITNWSHQLETRIIYFFRLKKRLRMFMTYLFLLLLWFYFTSASYGLWCLAFQGAPFLQNTMLLIPATYLIVIILTQVYQIYVDTRYKRLIAESGLRAFFICILIGTLFISNKYIYNDMTTKPTQYESEYPFDESIEESDAYLLE